MKTKKPKEKDRRCLQCKLLLFNYTDFCGWRCRSEHFQKKDQCPRCEATIPPSTGLCDDCQELHDRIDAERIERAEREERAQGR